MTRFNDHWGKSKAQASRLSLTPRQLVIAKERYNAQRKAAARRDIIWKFTFEQWANWWRRKLGNNWLKKRGRKKGQYVMARKGDKGPYSVANVECKLTEDNCSERTENGSYGDPMSRSNPGIDNGRAKITDKEAREIFLDKDSYSKIGKKYGIGICAIGYIKNKKTWTHATKDL